MPSWPSLGYKSSRSFVQKERWCHPVRDNHRLMDVWWRHQMETFSALLALCVGNSPVTGPLTKPVTRSFDVFFDLHLNKQLSKQSWGWWFETPWRSLWSHCMLLRQDNERLWHSCYHHPRWRHGGETFSALLDFIQGIPLEGPVCGVLVLQRLLGLLTVEQIGARPVNGEGT